MNILKVHHDMYLSNKMTFMFTKHEKRLQIEKKQRIRQALDYRQFE